MNFLKYILIFLFTLLLNRNVSATEIDVVVNQSVFFGASDNQAILKANSPKGFLLNKYASNKKLLEWSNIDDNAKLLQYKNATKNLSANQITNLNNAYNSSFGELLTKICSDGNTTLLNKISGNSWQSKLTALANDLANAPPFKTKLLQNPNLIDAWEHILNSRGASSVWKTDIDLLEKVADIKNNSTIMTRVGGDDGLEAILKANVRAGCKSCGNAGQTFLKDIDDYLDDVEHFVTNYGNNNGFNDVLAELKRVNSTGSPNYVMEGASFMIDKIKRTPEITPTSVNKFDGKFEINPDNIGSCTNCRFDVELNNGVKYEYKSYGETSVRKIGSINSIDNTFLKQHSSYLQDATSIDNIKYEFDLNKLLGNYSVDGITVNGIDFVKSQFKKMYQNNRAYIFNKLSSGIKAELDLTSVNSFTDDVIDEILDELIKLN